MTRLQALFVKLLRVRYDYSWRALHSEWQVRYVPKEEWWYNKALDEVRQLVNKQYGLPEDTPDGNQISGTRLCEEAMNFLGEDSEDGWN